MANEGALYNAAVSVASHAPTASGSLATISAGSDVLVSNFAGLKTLVDDLTSLANALKDNRFYPPVGSIMSFVGGTPPTGWLLCNGDGVPNGFGTVQNATTNFADLYAVLGGLYGTSGANRLLPNLRDRVPLSVGSTYSLGTSGGAATQALSATNLPTHTHSIDHDHASFNSGNGDFLAAYNHYSPGSGSSAYPVATSEAGGRTIQGAGASHTHSIDVPNYTGSSGNGSGTFNATPFSVVQPYVVVNFIIKY